MYKLVFTCCIIPLFMMVTINLSYPYQLMCWCSARMVLMVRTIGAEY